MADEKNRKGDKGPKSGKTKRTVGTVLGTGFFAVLSLIIIFPVFAGLLASFRPGTELIRRGLSIDLDIRTMNLDNYKYLFSGNADSQKYFMWYKNSLVITIVSVVLTLFICYFVAYGLTMYNFKLKNFLFFRQYLSGLPRELLDAARIDGATEYGIATKIILPLTKPAFASMGILQAMGSWNAILWPLLVLKGAEKFTLPIGLNTLLTPYGNNYDVLIAGSMFGILPILVIFLIFQKYIIEGMTAGAVKG